jgi:hypothetical protein
VTPGERRYAREVAQLGQRARPQAPLALVVAAMALTVSGAACGARFGDSRRDVRDRLVEDLTSPGIPPELAACVVDGFIETRSDDQLQDFIDRAELTDEERDELSRLRRACADPGGG